MVREFPDKVGQSLKHLGYIEPGHGLRGKQRWISSDEDLRDMYRMHSTKEILLWCFEESGTTCRKRPLEATSDTGESAAGSAAESAARVIILNILIRCQKFMILNVD